MEKRPNPKSGKNESARSPIILAIAFRHQFNSDYEGTAGEVNEGVSKTRPDMSLTVQELLLNHTRGIDSDVSSYDGEYYEDEPLPVIQDINDVFEYKEDLKNRQTEIENKLKKQKDEIKKNLGSNPDPFASDNIANKQTGDGKTTQSGKDPSQE